jgi:hypothetical protein
MPDARCTRSPLCGKKRTGVEATGTPESPDIPHCKQIILCILVQFFNLTSEIAGFLPFK